MNKKMVNIQIKHNKHGYTEKMVSLSVFKKWLESVELAVSYDMLGVVFIGSYFEFRTQHYTKLA